jgi:hypothetical protein
MRRDWPTCFLVLVLGSCAHDQTASADVFQTPSQFVGQTVRVCGYMIDSANIVESADREDQRRAGGLVIAAKGPLNLLHRGPVCVEGELTYVGCATGPVICTDAAFDYGIRVQRRAE